MFAIQQENSINFESFFKKLREPSWSTAVRKEAAKNFAKLPLPTRKDEEWKYTDVKGFTFFEPSSFAVSIVSPKGVVAVSMPDALEKYDGLIRPILQKAGAKDKFSAFCSAAWTNGYFVYADGNTENPVIVKHTAGEPACSRSVIVAERNARVTICEIFDGDAPSHYGTLDVVAKENAEVNVITVQRFGDGTWDHTIKNGRCERDARINWTFALLGGRTSKLKEETVFEGSGASSELKGVYFGTGKQHLSVVTNTNHEAPNTRANIETRGVLKDDASSMSRGLIRIEKVAHGTDSQLHDRTLHLSSGAMSNSIPSLEIENNDVRASHGSSTGKIDEEQMFYLMSRGLSREEAETLIVEGFFETVVNAISVSDVREGVRELVSSKITSKEHLKLV
ncbi:MAG: Fe-S cluster assembly protein SufD [Candidatus Aenigmarchaeota archaeon]|nr:Fe-S cluster assembly protein SufD [Candidatus Aenigmarchaeota archaeon]